MILRERGSIMIKINLLCTYGCHHKKERDCEDKLPTNFDEDNGLSSSIIIKEK